MQNKCDGILSAINSSRKKYNILTFPTHEMYASMLAKTDHNFFLWQGQGIKTWNAQYRKLPDNHILLDGSPNQVKPDMVFDMILSQNKAGQYPVAKQLSDALNIPLICLEHTLPPPNWSDEQTKQYTNQARGDCNIYISEYSIDKWFAQDINPVVIRHGIDTEFFRPIENGHNDGKVLTVANLYVERDWCLNFSLYKKICLDRKLPVNPVGDTPGLSKAAKDEFDLVSKYQNASVFFNSSRISPVPFSLIESAACGCPIVSTNTCLIGEVFKDNYDGFFSNDEQYLQDKLDWMLANPEKAKEYGQNARNTVIEKFGIDQFKKNWNDIFDKWFGSAHHE